MTTAPAHAGEAVAVNGGTPAGVASPAAVSAPAEASRNASPGVELFVYYRVPSAQAAAALVAARGCQRRILADYPSVVARLLRRPEPADGYETWMETYRLEQPTAGGPAPAATAADSPPATGRAGDGPAGIDAALQAAIEAHARPLAGFIDGARHVERFAACA